MAKRILLIWLFIALQSFTNGWPLASSKPKDSIIPDAAAYLGQTPPGDAAIVFAPGFISGGNTFVQNSTFSPDGKEFYFTLTNNKWDYFVIMSTKFKNGKWTIPAKAGFFENKLSMEPFFAHAGSRIYFIAGDSSNTDIWYCARQGETWSEPIKLPESVNTSSLEWFPSLSRRNTLFFSRDGEIFYSLFRDGHFGGMVNIGNPVNSIAYEDADPCIAPNEDYLIFHSYGRSGGYGQGDLYISYKKENGSWTNPKNIGPKINTEEFEFGPAVTADGKYFMFSRRKQWLTEAPSKIYWIKSDFIEGLKHSNFVPYVKNGISDQAATVGQPFHFTIPDNVFIDDDGNNTLTYSAVLENGDSLPSWVSFNPGTRTFSGTPTEKGIFKLKVTAADTAGAVALTTFTVTAANADGNLTKTAVAMVNPQVKGAFFSQALPGETPVLFAPDVLKALGPWVEATAFSPDGTQFFASVGAADYSSAKLYHSRLVNDGWTPFAEAPFIADFIYANESVFSADGATLTFTGKKAAGTTDLWTVSRTDQGWSTPVALPSPINGAANEFRGSTMVDGTMYFGSNRSGMMQVYKGYKDATRATAVELVGPPVSTNSYDGDPCIAPDGRFLIFYSARDGKSSNLYVSFSDGQEGWGTPINLGDGFNTAGDEYGAHLSADGNVLFFTRHTAQGNGIYWVATSAIDKLKK